MFPDVQFQSWFAGHHFVAMGASQRLQTFVSPLVQDQIKFTSEAPGAPFKVALVVVGMRQLDNFTGYV